MTNKEIEDYINQYRVYPREYKGKRDKEILKALDYSHRYDPENNTISKLEGYINDDGDFVLGKLYSYSLDDPEQKKPTTFFERNYKYKVKKYNEMMLDLGYPDSVVTDEINSDWNIRDMVAECDYLHSLYLDDGPKSIKNQDPIQHRKERCRLLYFVNVNKEYIDDMIVTVKHNSKYDNMEE